MLGEGCRALSSRRCRICIRTWIVVISSGNKHIVNLRMRTRIPLDSVVLVR